MDSIPVSPDMDKRRATFLRLLFEGGKGYFCIAYGPRNRDPKHFREEFFEFPDEIPLALELINSILPANNVWYCPHLFDKRRRKKETVAYTPCAWSDLDTCDPENLFVIPSVVVESSPGRFQGLWMFERVTDPDDAENLSKRIAYTHFDDGADRSGWDLTQLLRMPYTYNFKYATTPIVNIVSVNRKKYRLTDFDADYEKLSDFTYVDTPMPALIEDADDLLERERLKMNPTIWRLYQERLPEEASWSEPLWKLMMLLFEAGFDAAQVLSISNGAECNKFERRGQGVAMLWKDVCRAEAKYIQATDALSGPATQRIDPLITDEERSRLKGEDTFIERYIAWAKSLGDAAPQYHQAGAFTALSALLAGGVQLATSFGTIKPNLWFMILADTTLTRKSTAMDIAMDMVMEIDDDVLLATDGSLEGLLTSLSTRPSRPSVFLRDEFSGLLEMMTRKDYYAGMPELLTKLYDGKMQKRILRKEQIEVRDPCVLIFAGGIKDKITSLLSFEHVSSGFMPRFVFITAESDVTRIKPLGPPTDWTDSNRQAIEDELTELYEYYNQMTVMEIKDTTIQFEQKRKFEAKLTAEAWHRYNMVENQMLETGMASERPAIMTPVFDRLAKSILKAAVLLSCSRQRSDPIEVTELDIIRAAAYGEQWRDYAIDVMNSVGKGGVERRLDNIYSYIERKPGVQRSQIMQSYHLSARETNEVFETLEQRGLITRTKQGKAEQLFPTVIKRRATI